VVPLSLAWSQATPNVGLSPQARSAREIAREIQLVLHTSADDGILAVLLLVPNEIVTVTIFQRHEEFLRGRADGTCGST
jgi:hypothetical protein